MKNKVKEYVSAFSRRKKLLALADFGIVVFTAFITNFVLFLTHNAIPTKELLIPVIITPICCFASLFIWGAYTKMWRYYNQSDYFSCIYGVGCGVVATWLFVFVIKHDIHFAFALLHMSMIMLGTIFFRLLFKSSFIEVNTPEEGNTQYTKTMIIGGGQACKMMLKEISNAVNSPHTDDKIPAQYKPVCIIDDDRSKIGEEIEGVKIVGTTDEIEKYIKEFGVQLIIFAIPSCLNDERQRILSKCSATEIPVKVIPFIGNMIFDDKNPTILNQVRDIKVEDLLGREPITFDNKEIKNFISGKVCMVTGGGGSIGSELVRQIAKYSPEKIIIVDIYENNAYEIQQELIMEYGDSLNLVTLIASVRDYQRMDMIFKTYNPNIVFHAAAHKHVPLMEASPMEAIKNNVMGTFNVATLAQFHNVEKFVMVSTDKAVNPTNVMGASKRCCEMIVQYLSQQHEGITEFVTTRFGNVLGSNGSVIPLFKKQIEQGKPVTVTHPDVIRYFMTIPEAVNLVMEAAAIANGGEIFVLDMGQPVRIVALAENLIRMYGKVPYKDVPIIFTGLRPGEKIKEELLMDEEGLQKTSNELIFIGNQIEIDEKDFPKRLDDLRNAGLENNVELAIKALHEMVPTFVTPDEFNKNILQHENNTDEEDVALSKN